MSPVPTGLTTQTEATDGTVEKESNNNMSLIAEADMAGTSAGMDMDMDMGTDTDTDTDMGSPTRTLMSATITDTIITTVETPTIKRRAKIPDTAKTAPPFQTTLATTSQLRKGEPKPHSTFSHQSLQESTAARLLPMTKPKPQASSEISDRRTPLSIPHNPTMEAREWVLQVSATTREIQAHTGKQI
jgi:hypothetical protein